MCYGVSASRWSLWWYLVFKLRTSKAIRGRFAFLTVSVLVMSGRAIREEGADRLRSRPFKKVMRPWWPAGRAAAVAGLRSLIRRLFGRSANESTKKRKQAPRRRLVRND